MRISTWLVLLNVLIWLTVPGLAKILTEKAGPYQISFSVKPYPLIVGQHRVEAKITDASGTAVTGAEVTLQPVMPGMAEGIHPSPLTETSPGTYQGSFETSMIGMWNLILRISSLHGNGEATFQATVEKAHTPLWIMAAVILVLLIGLLLVIKYKEAVLVPLLIIFSIGALTLAGTKLFLKHERTDMMGMEMDMSRPDMGMKASLVGAPKAVAVEEVKQGLMAETVTYTGTIAPYLEEVVYPRVIGWLSKMPLYPGDKVERGQLITKLDWGELSPDDMGTHPGMQQGPHNEAVSTLALKASIAREAQAANELKKAEANLTYWQKEFPREETLLKEGAISKEEYDRESASYQSALSEKESMQKAYEAATSDREIAAHGLHAVRDYRILRAHLSGVVTERMINEGVLVQPGMGVLKIADIHKVRVQAFVAENDLAKIKIGTPVLIRTSKLPNKTIRARVTSIFNAVDPDARTGKVEALIDNPEEKLFPGDYTSVDFLIREKKVALSVPQRAVIAYQGYHIVWIFKNGLAKRRKVEPGISDGLRTEIRSGLSPGEKVIVAGQQDLVPDQPVVEGTWGSGNYNEILFPEHTQEMESMPGMQTKP